MFSNELFIAAMRMKISALVGFSQSVRRSALNTSAVTARKSSTSFQKAGHNTHSFVSLPSWWWLRPSPFVNEK